MSRGNDPVSTIMASRETNLVGAEVVAHVVAEVEAQVESIQLVDLLLRIENKTTRFLLSLAAETRPRAMLARPKVVALVARLQTTHHTLPSRHFSLFFGNAI